MNDKLRDQIVQTGQKLHQAGFIAGLDGNLSCRIDTNSILITPSGISKAELDSKSLLIIDLDGNLLEGDSQPSSESKMHTVIYRKCPQVAAIVHAHPPITNAFTVAGKQFPIDILPEGIITLTNLAWIDYATPSTDKLPDLIEPKLPESDILILKQHGVTTTGQTLFEAFNKLETLEHLAKVNFYAELLGGINRLPKDEVERIKALFKKR